MEPSRTTCLTLLYALWANLRSANDVIDDGDAFEFTWANPATANDVYDISTSQLVAQQHSVAQGKLGGVRWCRIRTTTVLAMSSTSSRAWSAS
jgi:hypothetical protein